MGAITVIVTALWAMLPAYVPNNVAVVAGGGRPIDGGRTVGGRRLLGDGKTWRGTVAGTVAGTALAVVLDAISPAVGDLLGVGVPGFPLLGGLGLALGAMVGDIGASFLKRRTGRDRGAPLPGVDQLDFVVGALVFAFVATPSWFRATFTPAVLLAVVLLTPALHVATNGVAYWLGIKDQPW